MNKNIKIKTLLVAASSLACFNGCKPRVSSTGQSNLRETAETDSSNLPTSIDMNDLSIMFPKSKTGGVYPNIVLSKDWSQTKSDPELAILRKSLFDNIVKHTTAQSVVPEPLFVGGPEEGFQYKSWRVVSLRIDPCAPTLALDSLRDETPSLSLAAQIRGLVFRATNTLTACSQQIRLIIQPLGPDGKTFLDSSIHLVYRVVLNAKISRSMLIDILKLKQAANEIAKTDGVPLTLHPALLEEEKNNQDPSNYGSYAKAILNFLTKYLKADPFRDPTNIAIIRSKTVEGAKKDVFIGAGAIPNSDPTLPSTFLSFGMATIPSIKSLIMTSSSDPTRFSFSADFKASPFPNAEQNSIVSVYKKMAKKATLEPRDLELLTTLDNPEVTHFFGTDCVSCHGASQLMNEVGIDNPAFLDTSKTYSVKFASGFRYPKSDFLPKKRGGATAVSTRNFGYFNGDPIISNRSITETASVVDYLNRRIKSTLETSVAGLRRLGLTALDAVLFVPDVPFEDMNFNFRETPLNCLILAKEQVAVSISGAAFTPGATPTQNLVTLQKDITVEVIGSINDMMVAKVPEVLKSAKQFKDSVSNQALGLMGIVANNVGRECK